VTPSSEQERWAFAARLLELHADTIGDFVEQRVRELAADGDEDGLDFWQDVTNKLLLLIGSPEGSDLN